MTVSDIGIRLSLQGQGEVTGGLERVRAGLGGIGSAAAGLATAMGAAFSAGQIIKTADAVTVLHNQLRLATGSVQSASRAYESLYDIAQRSRVSFTELGSTFAAIARAGDQLGVSQSRLLGVTEAISNAVAISGGSAESARASLVQLSQGLASGTLRGDELNSVMEQTPRLASALAAGLGVTTGELRKMGEAGEITASKVIKALESQSKVLAGEVKTSAVTVGQAFTQLGNAATKAVGEWDAATGASAALAGSLQNMAGAMDSVGKFAKEHETSVKAFFAAVSGAATVAGIAATGAGLARLAGAVGTFAAALAATPLGAFTLGLAAVTAGVAATASAARAFSQSETGLQSQLLDVDDKINRLQNSGRKLSEAGLANLEKYRARREALLRDLALAASRGDDGSFDSAIMRRAEAANASVAQDKANEQQIEKARALVKNRNSILTAGYKEAVSIADNFREAIDKAESEGDTDALKRLTRERDALLIGSAKETAHAIKAFAESSTADEREAAKTRLDAKIAAYEREQIATEAYYKREQEIADTAHSLDLTTEAEYQSDKQRRALEANKAQIDLTVREYEAVQKSGLLQKDRIGQEQKYTAELTKLVHERVGIVQAGNDAIAVAQDKDNQQAGAFATDAIKDARERTLALQAEVTARRQANAEIGLSAQQVDALRSRTIELNAAELERVANQQQLANPAYAQALRDQASAMRALIGANAEGVQKAAAVAEWTRTWESVDRTAHDVFVNIFNGGQDAFTKLRDVLKATLLDLLYQMTVRQWVLNVTANVVPGAPQSAVGGAAGAANTASGLGTLLGAGSQFLTGATAGSSSAALLGANAVGAVGGDALGALIAANGGWAGVSVAAETGAAAAATAGAASGASSALAAIPGWGWAALGVAALASLFGGDKGPQLTGMGTAKVGFDAAGNTTSKNNFDHWADFQSDKADTLVAGLQAGYLEAARRLGIGTVAGGFAYGSNNYNDGQFALHARVGSAVYDTAGTDGIKITDQAIAQEAARAVYAALKGSELPRYLAGVFDKIDASTATEQQITQVLDYAHSLKTLHDQLTALPFANLRDLSFEATQALLQLSGGIDALGQNLQSYYANFYREDERRAQTLKNINATLKDTGIQFTDLDIAAKDARDTFRAMVEGQDLTTDAGRKTYAALMSVQGAFAGLTASLDKVGASAQSAADSAESAAQTFMDAVNARYRAQADQVQAARDAAAAQLSALRDQAQGLRDEATQRYLTAQQSVTTAQQNLAGVLRGLVDGFQGVLDNLDGAVSGTQSLASARQKFEALAASARAGDGVAMQKLAGAASTLLDKSKGYSASAVDYRRDEARVRAAMEQGVAKGKANLAALGVDALDLDPLRSAQKALEKAYVEEVNARNLAISMQARLTEAQGSLAERYRQLVAQIPGDEGKALSDYFSNALDALSGKELRERAIKAMEALLPKVTGGGTTLVQGIIDSLKAVLPGEIGGDFSLMQVASDTLRDIMPDLKGQDVDLAKAAIDALDGWIALLPKSPHQFDMQDAAIDAISAILPKLPPGSAEFDFASEVRDTIAGILPSTTERTFSLVESAAQVLHDILPTVSGGTFNLAYTAYAALQALLAPAVSVQSAPLNMTSAAAGAIAAALPPIDRTPVSVRDIVQTAVNGMFPPVSWAGFNPREIAQAAINAASGGAAGSGATPQTTTPAAATSQEPSWVDRVWAQYTNPNAPRGSAMDMADFIRATYTLPNGGAHGGWLWSAAAHAFDRGLHVTDLFNAVHSVFPNALPTLDDVMQQLRIVNIPAFAVGTNYVPRDMLAQLHQGEAVIPAAFNPERYSKASGNDALVAEIKALRADVESLRRDNSAENNALITHARKSAQTAGKWDVDGLPPTRT